MNTNEGLPSFDRPPVIEVLASVQFDPPKGFSAVHFGLLWNRFRGEFPNVEQKPPLPQILERLGVASQMQLLQITGFSAEPPLPRLWFISPSGDELIQVQSDRFIRNWRAVPQLGNPYPRYRNCIRPRVEADYSTFVSLLESEGMKAVEPNQCELTYINHIVPNEYWSSHCDLSAVMRCLPPDFCGLLEYPTEAINMASAHLLSDDKGQFLGRLHITVQSAFREPQKADEKQVPVFVLTLTARGRPTAPGIDGVMGFLDVGHRAIVKSFDQITTAEMHKVWGKN
ncbi:MAG: hypothetical protein JWO52_2443 [Gammaproteobacteria bacterium]|jgi:uncharacterized protein (TIGR04255 family)|nr:hypothetical protein [Gammaproteobacteria bacterium]